MKRLGLLTTWIAMSFLSFSQGLKPSIHIIKSDTLYCFSTKQINTVGKHLANSRYCDSLEIEHEKKIVQLNRKMDAKDFTIIKLEKKTANQNSIIDDNTQSIDALNELVEVKDKKLRRSGMHKKFLTLGLVIVGVIAVIK